MQSIGDVSVDNVKMVQNENNGVLLLLACTVKSLLNLVRVLKASKYHYG